MLRRKPFAAFGISRGAEGKAVGPALAVIDGSKTVWIGIARGAGQAIGMVDAETAIDGMVRASREGERARKNEGSHASHSH